MLLIIIILKKDIRNEEVKKGNEGMIKQVLTSAITQELQTYILKNLTKNRDIQIEYPYEKIYIHSYVTPMSKRILIS